MTSKKNINDILEEHEIENVVAIVGTIDLHIYGVPFIPIDELIVGNGIKRIKKILNTSNYDDEADKTVEKIVEKNVLIEVLSKTLLFLDSSKAYQLIITSLNNISNCLQIKNHQQIIARYVLHCACMIERLIQKESLPYTDIENFIKLKEEKYSIVKNALIQIEEAFGINIPDTEIGYIIEIIDTVE